MAMNDRVVRLVAAARRSIELHGGGLRGLLAVAHRAFKLVRALGMRGLVRRMRAAGAAAGVATPMPDDISFPAPAPLHALRLKAGVMAHVFYPDLIEEFAGALEAMPVGYTLMVSVIDDAARAQAQARFSHLPNLDALHVRVVPNRGRDIAPLLVTFHDEILALDLVAHIHTKKSLYTGREQGDWRRYLVDGLFGDASRIGWILGMFQADERLGMIYPESFPGVPLWAHSWLGNAGVARELGTRLGIAVDAARHIDFPAGSMFWARVDALRPLYDLKLRIDEFPEEHGQTDATLQHAVERMFVAVARQQGFHIGVLPGDGTLALHSEGERNWQQALDTDLRTRITLSSLDASLVSLDVFDTLVLRPFLTPAAARAYLGHLVSLEHGIDDFAALRDRAEQRARAEAGRDVDLATIYQTMKQLPGGAQLPIEALLEMELALEARLLTPRQGVLDALAPLALQGKRLVALSDMYIDAATLRGLLPASVTALPQAWYVSCDTGWRKDETSAWQQLPQREHVQPAHWLHIGDNEHADIQLPQMHGLLTPVHVLRPSALLDVAPGLRPLRPRPDASWQDQLWLGLLANHFATLGDRDPAALRPAPRLSPASLGYTVLGPLLFDYLTWLVRLARERDVGQLLFLSREGHLLLQCYARLQQACPSLATLDGHYLLTSRRASGTASLFVFDNLQALFDSTYTGNLRSLLEARLGLPATAAVANVLGEAALAEDVFLPEMCSQLLARLAPAADALLAVAAQEREAYLVHWRQSVGDAPALVADIGYSGSIQANLARMTGLPLGGGYFALNQRASKISAPGWAGARYRDGRSSDEATSTIEQHDLLLETLLTSMDPQFSHYLLDQGLPRPMFAAAEHSAAQLATIAEVHTGTLRFFDDVIAAVGEHAAALEFDPDAVQIPLRCIGSGRWHTDDWLASLSVRDDFTGRGSVAAG